MEPLDEMTPEDAARTMIEGVTSPQLRRQCRRWQERVHAADGLEAAANQIERLWGRRPAVSVHDGS
jgi:hypothetical protein